MRVQTNRSAEYTAFLYNFSDVITFPAATAAPLSEVMAVPAITDPLLGWYQLVPAGTQLVPAGTSWYQLGPAGTSWVPAGTSWVPSSGGFICFSAVGIGMPVVLVEQPGQAELHGHSHLRQAL